jgi:hypothetical protein
MCPATISPSTSHADAVSPFADFSCRICVRLHSNDTGLSATRGPVLDRLHPVEAVIVTAPKRPFGFREN